MERIPKGKTNLSTVIEVEIWLGELKANPSPSAD